MHDADGSAGGEKSEGAGSAEWSASANPALRAVLDHIAEELAAEFVRLMKASVVPETDAEPEEERR